MGQAGFVQRQCGREDDEEHHRVGYERSRADIKFTIQNRLGLCAPGLDNGFLSFGLLLFDFLGALPKEQKKRC
jgi:hypothetical protein